MSDELRAAERLLDPEDSYDPGSESTGWSWDKKMGDDIEQVCRAYLAGPAWHDRPPVPGTYIMQYPGSETMGTIRIIDPNIYHGAGCRWFGPIPADPTRGD